MVGWVGGEGVGRGVLGGGGRGSRVLVVLVEIWKLVVGRARECLGWFGRRVEFL